MPVFTVDILHVSELDVYRLDGLIAQSTTIHTSLFTSFPGRFRHIPRYERRFISDQPVKVKGNSFVEAGKGSVKVDSPAQGPRQGIGSDTAGRVIQRHPLLAELLLWEGPQTPHDEGAHDNHGQNQHDPNEITVAFGPGRKLGFMRQRNERAHRD